MIDPKQLAFDIDGVLANTMQLFLDILRDVYGINHIVYKDITQYQYNAKPEVLKANNVACFVEDRLYTCFLMQQHDITPVVFAQPWNRQPHPFMEVDSWDQLENVIQWS